jgi:hypothetical protein
MTFQRWYARVAVSIVGVVALAAGFVTIAAPPASAAPTCGTTASPLDSTITDTPSSPAAGSLRAAVDGTDGDCSTVVLQAGATYVLGSGSGCVELSIDNSMTIESSSTSQNATIQQTCTSNFDSRVAHVSGGNTATLDNLNLTGGQQTNNGGALRSESSSTLILNNDMLTGNRSDEDGGAINSHGPLTVMNSTISGNCAVDGGGAILLNSPEGTTLIQNSTISGNTQGLDGGGAIENVSGALTLNYVTLVNNTSSASPGCGTFADSAAQSLPGEPNDPVAHPGGVGAQAPVSVSVANLSLNNDEGADATLTSFGTVIGDIASTSNNCGLGGDTPTSAGYNYENGGATPPTCGLNASTDVQSGADPNLGTLGANGGPTNTQVPQTGSALINAIPDPGGGCPESPTVITTDQRGITRPQGPGCEIGAVEVVVTAPAAALTVIPEFTG